MSSPNTKSLFISHVWNKNQPSWRKVVEWFESEPNFSWKNCSHPDLGILPDRSTRYLTWEVSRQIASAQAVIILSEVYAANSAWVDYEISEAKRMKKFIIGVAPLEHGKVPRKIRESADLMVGGSSSSLLNMVKLVV